MVGLTATMGGTAYAGTTRGGRPYRRLRRRFASQYHRPHTCTFSGLVEAGFHNWRASSMYMLMQPWLWSTNGSMTCAGRARPDGRDLRGDLTVNLPINSDQLDRSTHAQPADWAHVRDT